jgi:hypothetical protein
MRRVSIASSDPPPTSTVSSASSRTAATTLDADDIRFLLSASVLVRRGPLTVPNTQ